MPKSNNSLRALYVDELRDLYSAENQLTKAIPKLAKAANSKELRDGFLEHLEQTKGHVDRLQQIFEMLGEKPTGKKCAGMEGLVKEGAEVIDGEFEGAVRDAALIGAAQRVEHYEIAAYGTVCAMAELLDESEHASLLQKTLEEEKQTDVKLSEMSDTINPEAMQSDPEDSEVEKDPDDKLAHARNRRNKRAA